MRFDSPPALYSSYCQFTDAGRPEDEALSALRIMAGALASHPNLRALNLSDNALGEKGIRAFAAGLANKVGSAVLVRLYIGLHRLRA